MAAEVPVSDVLCEAMEYLSKLGSNLRARSESLKEKRIRKDKLRNSHAVQKAADKVLLICELSKKSLENVESGVRKVLSLLKENYKLSPAKEESSLLSSKSSHKSENKYQTINIMSRKLRIAKTVPVKHFMSVKVLARKMPKSMQDKYPIYHDCKLFRQRKRLQKKLNSDFDEKSNKQITSDRIDSMQTEDNDFDETGNKQITTDRNDSKQTENADFDGKGNKQITSDRNDSKQTEDNPENTILKVEPKSSDIACKKSTESYEDKKGDETDTNSSLQNKRSASSSKTCKTENKNVAKRSKRLPSKKFKHIKVFEDSSENSSEPKVISLESDNEGNSNEKPNSVDDSIIKNSEPKMAPLESEHDANSNKNEIENSTITAEIQKSKPKVISVESEDEKEIEKSAEANSDQQMSKINDVANVCNDSVQENVEKEVSDQNEVCKTTPLIKCVSINKLLKPDILKKSEDVSSLKKDDEHQQNPDKKKEKKHEIKKVNSIDKYLLKKKSRESVDKNKENNLTSDKNSTSDEEYWSRKRMEVSTFKSKKFSIKIHRLPPLTVNFLESNNLNKITQHNKIICELNEKQNKIANCSDKENNTLSKEAEVPTEKIKKVKNALLNESDSEKTDSNGKSPIDFEEIMKSVKNALLDFSVDDNRNSEKEKTSENVRDTMVIEASNHKDHTDTDKDDRNVTISKENRDIENEQGNSKIQQDSGCDENEKNNVNQTNADIANKNEDLSLLNVSESDENSQNKKGNIENNQCNIEQVKHALLTESGSDKNEQSIDKNLKKNCSENLQKSPNNSSKEDKSDPETSKHNTDEQLDIPLNRKRKRKDSKTKSSKRKHIMESMHAKKMLLTYSSSDTEDEQLKDALKEIKDSLLKEISSDDEKAGKSKVSKESSASSESEEDIVKKVKRAKKSKKSPSFEAKHKRKPSTESGTQKNREKIGSADENSDSCNGKMRRSRAQPGGSSHNSDSHEANDKDIDGLTNLDSLHRRRRDSTATDNTSSTSVIKTRRMAKVPLISEQDLLKPDSSSDAASASGAESDGQADDLPPVTLSGFNGSGINHMAKDDLLDESDTSTSHNEKEEASKKSESEEDHNPKSKRRKANAISSDSEAGSSRKKDKDVKISDFEDSEEESSEPAKRSKRKNVNDSDASEGTSSTDGSKKKRRRIKQVDDSEGSGSDSENEGRNKHGRKNIRKVMSKNQLEEATKKAAREEKERIARIAERQKVYNNLEFDESGKPDEVVLEKVVLDFDPETKEPLIQVDRGLVKKLKPHQANGIKFMWDACFESVKRIKKDRGSGCILAHCMGLGKTLQVVSLTHTLLTHSDLTTVNRVLVVCPLSTVLNWVNEFKMWLKHCEIDYEVDVYELSRYKQNSERAFQLQQWLQHGGVCVLGYEMFRNLSADNSKKFKKKMLKNFQEALVDPGPDLVVCDEGHLLKNEKTSLSQSMNRVRTHRRIVLTGTPLQNNLKEYYCMVQFVKPNLLGKYNEYLNRFVNPITNGQYTDSTEHDIRIMKRRSHVLHKMLDGAVQRRDYGVLAPFLPPKHEYVLFITLTEVQIKLYQFYLDNYSRRPQPGKSSGFLFPDFQSLQRIWTHPLVLKYNSERYEIMQQKKREREEEEDSEGSLVDFIDDDSTPDESSTEESSDDLSDVSDDSRKKSKKKKSHKKKAKDSKISTRRGTRANPVELVEDDGNNDVVEMKAENPTEWWIKLVTDEEIEDMRNSHKLILLFDILRQCEAIGDKLLVFSQSLYSLDLIEHFLGKVDEATQEGRIDDKLAGHVGSWSPGIDYFRLDGSTSCENRSIWCKNFNREDNPRARLFLISTRAGGLGINLVAANRVVIFDVSWNPSHDVQSIFRVYRFGQKKPCYVYRFLAMGTMEEKIYERQVTKQAISKRVIDEQQIDRHYAENDLAELYKFEPRPPTPRPLPPLPKDRLFAEMLREHEAQIYKYHEHDSLLENKEEETLSEEERKAAWEDFENEKNRPPPAPFPSAWPMHNGMVPGLLAQQQQQLAYAALAAMLRKDMPNINDNTIRDMLPHIYNSNPAMFGGYDYGLMQKISELYKFAPPGGMMNPGMMNMNAGMNAGGGALGGSSGLQYEPPWQRQHQQQQQMRLQQLMQHQNMGAKYYAGGLGSRDPVAMALQQQRAREIMAGDSRSRPRGRPPLQPRAPPPAHADIVNLDSD